MSVQSPEWHGSDSEEDSEGWFTEQAGSNGNDSDLYLQGSWLES
jgi:hypothetical protein